MHPRLSDYTDSVKARTARLTVSRALQCLYKAQGDRNLAALEAEAHHEWLDRPQLAREFRMAAVGAVGTSDINQAGPGFVGPVSDSFLATVRDFSIPMQLEGLRRVPARTRVYTDAAGVVATEIAQGAALKVVKGSWAETSLAPRVWGGILVQTEELFLTGSAAAQATLAGDLAEAVAEAENYGFLHPDTTGSVTATQLEIATSGSTVAAVDADLRQMIAAVPAARKGAVWCMPTSTATFLATLRGSGGSRAYPEITPFGGFLLGMEVFVTESLANNGSPPTSIMVLVAPSQIFYSADQPVELAASRNATLEMSDAPTGDSSDGTQGITSLVSMFQANAVALRGTKAAAWHARSGAATFCRCGF